jgi:hypothetical protein
VVVPQVTHVAPDFQQFSGVSMCASLLDLSRKILCHVRLQGQENADKKRTRRPPESSANPPRGFLIELQSERSAERRRNKASERVPVSPQEANGASLESDKGRGISGTESGFGGLDWNTNPRECLSRLAAQAPASQVHLSERPHEGVVLRLLKA